MNEIQVKKPGMFSRMKSKVALLVGAATMMLVPVAAHAQADPITFDAGVDAASVNGILSIVGTLFSEFWMLFALGLALIVLPRIVSIVKATASGGRRA